MKNIPFQIYLVVSWHTLCDLIYDAPMKKNIKPLSLIKITLFDNCWDKNNNNKKT